MVFFEKVCIKPFTSYLPHATPFLCLLAPLRGYFSCSTLDSGRSTGLPLQQKGSTFTKNLHAKAYYTRIAERRLSALNASY